MAANLLSTALGLSQPELPGALQTVGRNSLLYLFGESLISYDCLKNSYVQHTSRHNFADLDIIINAGQCVEEGDREETFILTSKACPDSRVLTLLEVSSGTLSEIISDSGGKLVTATIDFQARALYFLLRTMEGTEFRLHAWCLNRKRHITKTVLKSSVEKILVNPSRARMIALLDSTHVRMAELRPTNNTFIEKKPLPLNAPLSEERLLDMLWLTTSRQTYLVVLATNNLIYFFHNEDLDQTIFLDPLIVSYIPLKQSIQHAMHLIGVPPEGVEKVEVYDPGYFVKLLPLEKGFALCTSNFCICICDIQTDTSTSKKEKLIYIPQGYCISSEEIKGMLLYDFSINYNATLFCVGASFPRKADLGEGGGNKKQSRFQNFSAAAKWLVAELLVADATQAPVKLFPYRGFQSIAINKIRCAADNSTFLVLSSESVQIINASPEFFDRTSIVIKSTEGESIHDADIHPTGHFVALAMRNRFKVVALTRGRPVPLKEIGGQGCMLVSYTPRARYLLATNCNVINVYDGIHYNHLFSFGGHSEPVIRIFPLCKRRAAISYCAGDELILWPIVERNSDTTKSPRDPFVVDLYKHTAVEMYIDFSYDEDADFFLALGKSRLLQLFRDNCTRLIFSIRLDHECRSMSLNVKLNALFLGASRPDIRVLNLTELRKLVAEFSNTTQAPPEIGSTSLVVRTHNLTGSMTTALAGIGTEVTLAVGDESGNFYTLSNEIASPLSDTFFLVHSHAFRDQILRIRSEQCEVEHLSALRARVTKRFEQEFEEKSAELQKNFEQNFRENNNLQKDFSEDCRRSIEEASNSMAAARMQLNSEYETEKITFENLLNYEQETLKTISLETQRLVDMRRAEIITFEEQHHADLEAIRERIGGEINALHEDLEKLQAETRAMVADEAKAVECQERLHEITIHKQAYIQEREYQAELSAHIKYKLRCEAELAAHNSEKLANHTLQMQFEALVLENATLLEEKMRVCLDILCVEEQIAEIAPILTEQEEEFRMARHTSLALDNFRMVLQHQIQNFSDGESESQSALQLKEKKIRRVFAELSQYSQINAVKKANITFSHQLLHALRCDFSLIDARYNAIRNYIRSFSGKCKALINQEDLSFAEKQRRICALLNSFCGIDLTTEVPLDIHHGKSQQSESYKLLLTENERLKLEIAKINRTIPLLSSGNIKQQLIGHYKNCKLIEECNKLIEENDSFQKLTMQLSDLITAGQNELRSIKIKG